MYTATKNLHTMYICNQPYVTAFVLQQRVECHVVIEFICVADGKNKIENMMGDSVIRL